MDDAQRIERTADHIREALAHDGSGHDWWHIWRVWRTARWLAREEHADSTIVQLAALLHDVADWKFHDGDDQIGPRRARQWLEQLDTPAAIVAQVVDIVEAVTFKGAGVATPTASIEAACVQDADRLDALGAIGIARAFAYGGSKGRPLHDPTVSPTPHASFAEYKRNAGPTINHFHEKLLLLRDRMQTQSARRLAARRHQVLVEFLEQFQREWDGDDEGANVTS